VDNLTLLALFIMVLWLAAIGYYFYTSRQQDTISQEIDDLRELLGNDNEETKG